MVQMVAETSDRASTGKAAARPRPRSSLHKLRMRLSRDRWLVAFGLPGMVALILFGYLPLLGDVIAFKDYQPFIGILDSPWVGLDNFRIIVNGDPEFLNALKNTVIISLLQVFVIFPAPIALALLFNSLMSERIKRVVQSVLYLPHFMSWVIVVAIFQQLLGNAGLVNTWLLTHGHDTVNVIGNATLFKPLIVAQLIWKDTGWGTILFLAALSRIDIELYEAAAADGASRLRQMWHITLPGIRPVIVLLAILRFGEVLNVGFEQILLQQGSVGRETSEVLDTYIYNNGILIGDWGSSAAVDLANGVVGLTLILMANKVAHWFGERGIYQK